MARTPRPAARVLLAGRFVVSRAALVALPSGPVPGVDLARGELVCLGFGPSGDDHGRLLERIDRWNAHAPAGSPVVRELAWHRGRPLLAYELPSCEAPADARSLGPSCRVEAFAADLAAAGLGLPVGPADVAIGVEGPALRRPAVWPADPARPLAVALAPHVARLLERLPGSRQEMLEARRVRALPRRLTGRLGPSRRLRFAGVIACGAVAVIAVSGTTSGGGSPARPSAFPARAVAPLHAVTAPARPTPHRSSAPAALVRPMARGGPARVLALPRVRHPAPAITPAIPWRPRATMRAARPAAHPGWVEGLFVGS